MLVVTGAQGRADGYEYLEGGADGYECLEGSAGEWYVETGGGDGRTSKKERRDGGLQLAAWQVRQENHMRETGAVRSWLPASLGGARQ